MSISSLHERHKRPMRFAIQSSFISLLAVGLSACSSFSSMTASDKVDYKKQGEVRGPNLALPPDLITAQADRRYIVQDGTATMSEYSQAVKKSSQMRTNVLTGIPGMKIERDGDKRWLVVDKSAATLYPQIKDFWQENGFLLLIDSPSTGIMETDWAENRTKIPQDIIRRTLGKVLVIGDNLNTDISGANNFNVKNLFIAGGIHKPEWSKKNISLANFVIEKNKYFKINYFQNELIW